MDIITLFIFFIVIELFESTWQKSQNLYGLLYNNYHIYKKSIFMYFLFNGSFFYSIFLSTYLNNMNFLMLSIVAFKFFDIAFKLTLMKRIDSGYNVEEVLPNINITFLLRYLNVFIYPITFIIAAYYI